MEADKKKLFKEFPSLPTTDWEAKIQSDLKGADYEKKLIWNTYEGISLKPYYRQEDRDEIKHAGSLPGEFPFVRGYSRNNDWLRSVTIENPLAEPGKIQYWLKREINSFIINAKDITSFIKLEKVLAHLDLTQIFVFFKNIDCYRFHNELMLEFARNNKFDPAHFQGGCLADIFSSNFLKGEKFSDLPGQQQKLIGHVRTVLAHFPETRCISIPADIFHNAGGHAVQEIAFAAASGIEYLDFLTESGFPVDSLASMFRFSFATGSQYFIEIAKLRAFRLLWSHILKQYKPENLAHCKSSIHSVSSKYNKSIYDRHTNMLRNTTEAMSAILGGTDSLEIAPYDSGFAHLSEHGERIANNLHLILAHESNFNKVADPSAGSYYIEKLTQELFNSSLILLKEIEIKGGIIPCFENGWISEQLRETNERRNTEIFKRKDNILGTSIYPDTDEKIYDGLPSKANTSCSGQHKKSSALKLRSKRKAFYFESLRLQTEQAVKNGMTNPVVFLVPFGNPGMASARQIFARNFFGCAGFELIENTRFDQTDKAVFAALNQNADIVVLCSSDEEYPAFAKQFIPLIREKKPGIQIIVAGNPVADLELLNSLGVNGFIHANTDIVSELEKFQKHFNLMS